MQKGVVHFLRFWSPFGNHFVTFFGRFWSFFAYPLFPPPLLRQGDNSRLFGKSAILTSLWVRRDLSASDCERQLSSHKTFHACCLQTSRRYSKVSVTIKMWSAITTPDLDASAQRLVMQLGGVPNHSRRIGRPAPSPQIYLIHFLCIFPRKSGFTKFVFP